MIALTNISNIQIAGVSVNSHASITNFRFDPLFEVISIILELGHWDGSTFTIDRWSDRRSRVIKCILDNSMEDGMRPGEMGFDAITSVFDFYNGFDTALLEQWLIDNGWVKGTRV